MFNTSRLPAKLRGIAQNFSITLKHRYLFSLSQTESNICPLYKLKTLLYYKYFIDYIISCFQCFPWLFDQLVLTNSFHCQEMISFVRISQPVSFSFSFFCNLTSTQYLLTIEKAIWRKLLFICMVVLVETHLIIFLRHKTCMRIFRFVFSLESSEIY